MWSQVSLKKHHYDKLMKVMEFSWAISNPKRWCCESAAFNMPANLKNSVVATGLEKVSFHSNSKERHCQKCSNYCTIALNSHPSSESNSVTSDSLWPHALCSPWNSPGRNPEVGSLFLLQGIFPTQRSNPCLLHCRQILYQLRHK